MGSLVWKYADQVWKGDIEKNWQRRKNFEKKEKIIIYKFNQSKEYSTTIVNTSFQRSLSKCAPNMVGLVGGRVPWKCLEFQACSTITSTRSKAVRRASNLCFGDINPDSGNVFDLSRFLVLASGSNLLFVGELEDERQACRWGGEGGSSLSRTWLGKFRDAKTVSLVDNCFEYSLPLTWRELDGRLFSTSE